MYSVLLSKLFCYNLITNSQTAGATGFREARNTNPQICDGHATDKMYNILKVARSFTLLHNALEGIKLFIIE